MFPDSKIVENFSCGKTKCSYVVCFGIAPCFKGLLTKSSSNVEHIVAFFDESFNKRSKHGQIGIIITTMYVATCYYHSEFMGKSSTKDVFESFTVCLSGISKSKLLQVCSDSPNVNLSFLNLLEKDRNEKERIELNSSYWNIWSTYFATLEHCEKATGWNEKKLLSSLHRIFDESQSRTADCEALTRTISLDLPVQFCAHRWINNEGVG